MTTPFVTLRRYPYEEPFLVQVELIASSGAFSGGTDFYTSPDDLRALGTALRGFPTRTPQELVYEYGSEEPSDRSCRPVRLRAYTVNRVGHCALQLSVNRNAGPGGMRLAHAATFRTEPGAVNRQDGTLDPV